MKIIQLYPDDAEKTFLQASILLRPKGKTITEANITNPNAASLHCVPTMQNGSTSGEKKSEHVTLTSRVKIEKQQKKISKQKN